MSYMPSASPSNVSFCVYMYVYIYIYIYVCVYTYTYMVKRHTCQVHYPVCVCVCVRARAPVSTHTYIYANFGSRSSHVAALTTHTHIFLYTYTNIHTQSFIYTIHVQNLIHTIFCHIIWQSALTCQGKRSKDKIHIYTCTQKQTHMMSALQSAPHLYMHITQSYMYFGSRSLHVRGKGLKDLIQA